MNDPRTAEVPPTPDTRTPAHPSPEAPSVETPSWDRLVSTALVGTSRRAVPHLPDLPRSRRAGAAGLLDLVAVDTVRTRAGYTAHTAEPVTPDEPDPRPQVGADAAHRLDAILANRPELLPEWLDLAVRGGRRVSHTQTPDLLERASRDSSLRPLVATAVGRRGTWLASFNSAWSFIAREPLATDVHTDRAWHHGTPAERRRTLFALRATDPAAARDLLAAAWPSENRGEERRGLLEALTVNLGPDDEAVLDQALDDRSANVRGLALTLLTRLPDSAHAHRLRSHLREHLDRQLSGGRGAPRAVDIVDMDVTAADQLRDLALVPPKKWPRSRQERWELGRVLVTHAPLDTWTERLRLDPTGVLNLAEEERDLREALADAVCLQADPDWARALLDHPGSGLAQLLRSGAMSRHWPRTRELFAALPGDERCAAVLAALGPADDPAEQTDLTPHTDSGWNSDFSGERGVLGQVLHAVGAPWTRELSEEVVRRLARPLSRRDARGYRFLCEAVAEHMPPEHLDLLPEQPPHEEEGHAYLHLRETLRFRLDMHREL
ncbi:DUF5691 domain-containing protein [Nocardiopsis ganjiahuensis]|uniref:DUF5691 domain-containing protein n=1 Tax=Nocardiopsis ganjiahuensis TaxID=239984 RepID=UPI000346570F|nr:DUF5691 domain-containing protein [Nocardiopsis ganjiahuensis]